MVGMRRPSITTYSKSPVCVSLVRAPSGPKLRVSLKSPFLTMDFEVSEAL